MPDFFLYLFLPKKNIWSLLREVKKNEAIYDTHLCIPIFCLAGSAELP